MSRPTARALGAGLLALLAACGPLGAGVHAQAAPGITVDAAWVRAAAEGQFETWAFATIDNPGKADSLVEVVSPDAERVVLRAVTVTDAGNRMRSVLAIPVPAGGRLTLSADTYCLAFIRARHALVAGQEIAATLRFASGARVAVNFRVGEANGGN